ncbi:DUF1501 domain-containing protein [Sphingoaurantiacus capsulatus]|uniref:DUF1501 domain-containing protein n=1 Tax=Sphingoaurantiacus capsulatus TaxID=1771310 RepID=A0ABV7XEN9_9SPHN
MPSRRSFLAGAGAALLLPPQLALAAAATDRRFVFLLLRGAMDGVGTVIPYADPGYAAARRQLAIGAGEAIKLDGMFALHPAMTRTAQLYRGGEALFVHAAATPYRDRSHFDAQNLLETGAATPHALRSGWMNRLLAMLPDADDRGLALSPALPLIAQGQVPVTTHAPSALPGVTPDLVARVGRLYGDDMLLQPLWQKAVAAHGLDAGGAAAGLPALAKLAASFLAKPDGPRLAVIESDGWDTHAGQAARLNNQLGKLDEAIGALRDGLGAAWADTLVIAATEFGRTVAVNGTGGTDHGTGSAAILAGGAVRGGTVVADWPGLGAAALHEGRDLRPTADLYAMLAGSLGEHLRLEPVHLSRELFKGSARPMEGLVRA